MKKITLNNNVYELIKDKGNCFNLDELEEKFTDYFDEYDYVFADYAYDKIRLKGFFDFHNKKATEVNDLKYLDEYIENYCAYGANYFLLKKIK